MNLFKIPLTFTYQEILPFLGLKRDPTGKEKELLEQYRQEIKQLAAPVGIWKTFVVKDYQPKSISLEKSPLLLTGANTAAHFKTCAQITLLATTLGEKVDELLFRLSSQSPAEALIADAVASAAIEYFTEQFDQYLSQQIRRKGYFPTARYSPGYGDWELKWQKEFLASVEGEKIGLTATDHFLILPTKSITAALGWSNLPNQRTYHAAPPLENNSAKKPYKPCRSAQTCPYCHLACSCPDRFS